jgi:ribosomal protein S18 acetylase RimI-like enzyme
LTGVDEQLVIRSGRPGEVDAVLALWRGAGGRPSLTDTREALDGLLRRDPQALLIASSDGRIVGSLIAAWDGWRGSFYRLAVDPDWRRRGIALSMIRAGEDRLRALGALRLTAIVAREERAAIRLWAEAGYERQRDTCRFIRMLEG